MSPQPSRREPLWGVWVSSTCDRDSDDGWLHDLNLREPWTGTEEQAKAHAAKLGALWRQRYGHEARPMPTDPSSEADSRELRGYVVRGGDGGGTALFGYAWTSKGKYELLRAVGDGLGQLVVKRFPPTEDGRRRALLVAIAVGGTVKRVMKRVRRSGK